MAKWKKLTATAPKDRILLGCWIDSRGDEIPVLIRFDPSNLDSNHGFIGTAGQRYAGPEYGAGGIVAYQDIRMPNGFPPND